MNLNYIIYFVVFLYLANWQRLHSFIPNLINPPKTKNIEDSSIRKLLEKKTGLKNVSIKIIDSNISLGMMPGIPIKPVMILTTRLFEQFNKEEQEWVILHEAGHCVLWHTIKMAILHFLIMFFGFFLLLRFDGGIILAILMAILFSIVYNLISRYFEYEADRYSLERIDNPKAMITANQKLEGAKGYSYYKNPIIRTLFTPGLSYSNRIKMAQDYLNR